MYSWTLKIQYAFLNPQIIKYFDLIGLGEREKSGTFTYEVKAFSFEWYEENGVNIFTEWWIIIHKWN